MKTKIEANTEKITHSRILLEEKKTKITFLNVDRKEVHKVRIDGGVITEGIRCDYLIIYPKSESDKVEHFVELKGTDIVHAFMQLDASIDLCCMDRNKPFYAFIVSTSCPLSSSQLSNMKSKLKKKYKNCTVERVRSGAEVDLKTSSIKNTAK